MNIFRQRQKRGRLAGIVIPAFIILFVTISALFVCLVLPFRPIADILMYHSVSDRGTRDDPLVITGQMFSHQMQHLSEHGYEPVFLSTVIQRYKEGKHIPSNWVVLTFDDGKTDFYSEVYPVLKAHGFKAVLFVSPGRLESTDEFLTWAQLKEIKSGGLVEIGSHGVYHDPLTHLPAPEAADRIMRSKAMLEDKLGTNVALFAYPYGAFDYKIEAMVKTAGYEGAAGTVYPVGKFMTGDIYNMRRVFVSSFAGYPFMFRFMLSGYYVPIRALLLRLLGIDAPRDVAGWSPWTNSVSRDD